MHFDRLRRREFLGVLGGAVAWPMAAGAEQHDRMRLIGVLMTGSINAQLRMDTIQQGLQKLGWVDGRNVRIEYRWAVGDAEKVRTFAKELVDKQPDALLVMGSPALQAVLRETRTVPIVFVQVADPVSQGFVASLAHPGGNATGFTNFEEAMGGKLVALLKEIAPNTARVALLANPETTPHEFFSRSVETAASRLGVGLVSALVHNTSELETTISALGAKPDSALFVLPDFFTSTHRDLIIKLAAQNRVPAIYAFRFFTRSGGLISYGVDPEEPFGQAPGYLNRILRGERPGDLPVQAPTRFELSINLKTANALGLTVPDTLLALADEVIE
jgi:putative ABC transport system substrate-binding protein